MGVTSRPAQVAMKAAPTMCMMAVPFMLMVMPTGRTKLVISSLQPNSLTQVSLFRGRAGAEAAAPKAMMATLIIFFMKMKGLQWVEAAMAAG